MINKCVRCIGECVIPIAVGLGSAANIIKTKYGHSVVLILCLMSVAAAGDPPVVTGGDPGPTSVMLSWIALPGVTRYEVSFERSPAPGSQDRQTECASSPHEGIIDVGTATEYTLDDLEEDSAYTITVTAVYMGGSASSEPEMITTLQAGNIKSTN